MSLNKISLVGYGLLAFNILAGAAALGDPESDSWTKNHEMSITIKFRKSSGFPFFFRHASVEKTYDFREGTVCTDGGVFGSFFGWPVFNADTSCRPIMKSDVKKLSEENSDIAKLIDDNVDKIMVYAPQPMQPLKAAP